MSLKKLLIAFLLLVTAAEVSAVKYEQLPNRPYWNGFYYCLDMSNYPMLLNSSMPREVLQGYIVADSLVKLMPDITYMWNPVDSLNMFSDTMSYLYKYWYLMNEYDPLRFYAFMNWKYPEVKTNISPGRLRSELTQRFGGIDTRLVYAAPAYILHVRVHNTVWIDTSDTRYKDPINIITETIAYCQVLDTIKGGSFPSLDDAIFYNSSQKSAGTGGTNNSYIIPQQSDLVFSYVDKWSRWSPYGPALIEYKDSKPIHWIEPNKEYIVFLRLQGSDAKTFLEEDGIYRRKHYYSLVPSYSSKYCGMYPIEDGFVLDERNSLGFGERVPVEEFKKGIRNKINEIKSYGE